MTNTSFADQSRHIEQRKDSCKLIPAFTFGAIFNAVLIIFYFALQANCSYGVTEAPSEATSAGRMRLKMSEMKNSYIENQCRNIISSLEKIHIPNYEKRVCYKVESFHKEIRDCLRREGYDSASYSTNGLFADDDTITVNLEFLQAPTTIIKRVDNPQY